MFSYMLQDWTTLRGASGMTNLSQPETDWVDLSGFYDVVAWLEVKEVTGNGGVNLFYETSPTKDEALFVPMTSAPVFVSGPGVTTTSMLKLNAATPVARWMRWRINSVVGGMSPAWDITFRVYLACNGLAQGAAIPM